MKRLMAFAWALCALTVTAADSKIPAVYTVSGELNDIAGHIQGAACSTQGVYLSHSRGIYKIGWNGRLIAKCEAPYHLGDLAYHNGRIYGALALGKPIDGKKGMIRVWDEDLNIVKEHMLDFGTDGCVVLNDVIYYGRGPNPKEAHRGCNIGMKSLDFKDLGVVKVDIGGQMRYGVQTMATDGEKIFGGFYGAGSPSVNCAKFSTDLRICEGTPRLHCSQGFGMIPKDLFPSQHPRFFTVNAIGGGDRMWHSITNPPQVRLDFYEYRDGKFFDVTDRRPPPYISREDFFASDPFIYYDKATKLYRLYLQSYDEKKKIAGVQMRTSKDMRAWSVAKEVLRVPAKRKCASVWAPEMHAYKGKFYMFATISTHEGAFPELPLMESGDWKKIARPKRGTWIYKSDSPEGPFTEWSDESIPPPEWSTLDGTLWVEGGKPYMVFCHEWTQVRDGRMVAVEMSEDLKRAVGEPFELFRASSRPDADKDPNATHVTDGPWLYRSHNGSLLMLWSSTCKTGYCVYVTKSESGTLAGPWGAHKRIFDADGGHAMLFETRHHQLTMCLHQPNGPWFKKRTRFLQMLDMGDTLEIIKN